MTEIIDTPKIHTPKDKDWLEQTDWRGDFQPSLLGAPRDLEKATDRSSDVRSDTLELTQRTQDKAVEALGIPEEKNIIQVLSNAWNESFLGKILFFMKGK